MKTLWKPSPAFSSDSNMKHFMDYVNQKHELQLQSYPELHAWSVQDISVFWKSVFDYYRVLHHGTVKAVCDPTEGMIGTQWFTGTMVNYAEHVFRNKVSGTAIYFQNEKGIQKEISWEELEQETAKLVQYYQSLGLGRGSRCAFLPNIPEAIIAFLACNAVGAIWSSCSPDFGTASVIDRFAQIEPDLLLVANGYHYNGKYFDKTQANNELLAGLISVQNCISIHYCDSEATYTGSKVIAFEDIPNTSAPLSFTRIAFNEPIWVLYSSGTTGKPKAITHSVGGILIEHFKAMGLHQNVKAEEVFFWFSTTGWMMWNYANAALLLGASVAIYDGSPGFPSLNGLWDFAARCKVNHFGAGASFYISCMKQNLQLNDTLPHLKSLGSTGSPLTPEAFSWIYGNIKSDLWLISLSGGTDVCSGFVGGNPFEPVIEGEIQCRMLGVDLQAYNEQGIAVENELGEMVITQALPSMPIYFWGDTNNKRYHDSYFEMYPNIWRHGDWIKICERGSLIIYGRSDSTLNRGGVRIGTSEVYNAVESIDEIQDSVVVCIDEKNGQQNMLLFVVPKNGIELNDALKKQINQQLRSMYSPRHVPDKIHAITEVPYTISGKKMEAPIKKLLSGMPLGNSISKDAMKNPKSLDFFEQFGRK